MVAIVVFCPPLLFHDERKPISYKDESELFLMESTEDLELKLSIIYYIKITVNVEFPVLKVEESIKRKEEFMIKAVTLAREDILKFKELLALKEK